MAVTPQKLEKLAAPVIEIYTGMQTEMLVNIAIRLKGDKGLLTDDVVRWQARKLDQLGALTRDNVQLLAKSSGKAVDEINKMLLEAGVEGIQQNEGLLQQALKKGAQLTQPDPPRQDPTILNVLGAFQRQASDRLNLVNSTMLGQSQQVYRDILNRTTAEVLAGVKTPQVALRDTVRGWADKGIPALVDRAGRTWNAEGYVSMVTRTMSNQITNEMQDARFDSWGVDLVEISSHAGARPGCEPYQGRIFARSGSHPDYPSLYDTSIGEPGGLFGINCGHVQYPYFPGISVQRYHPEDEAQNDGAYEESQKQRALERSIRQAKTEMQMFDAMDDAEGAAEAKARVQHRQAQMREFINDTDRTRRRGREQIY